VASVLAGHLAIGGHRLPCAPGEMLRSIRLMLICCWDPRSSFSVALAEDRLAEAVCNTLLMACGNLSAYWALACHFSCFTHLLTE